MNKSKQIYLLQIFSSAQTLVIGDLRTKNRNERNERKVFLAATSNAKVQAKKGEGLDLPCGDPGTKKTEKFRNKRK